MEMSSERIARLMIASPPKEAAKVLLETPIELTSKVLLEIFNIGYDQSQTLLGSEFLKIFSKTNKETFWFTESFFKMIFAYLPLSKEKLILNKLSEEDWELHSEVSKYIPNLDSIVIDMHEEAIRNLLSKFSDEHLKNLFIFFNDRSDPKIEKIPKRNHYHRKLILCLDSKRRRSIHKLYRKNQTLSEKDEENLIKMYRSILNELKANSENLYWRSGGHSDPEIAVYAYKVVIKKYGDEFVATIPDYPSLRVVANSRKLALKKAGDVIAQTIDQLLKEKKEFDLPEAVVSESGIAVGDNFAENYWHYELDHITEFDED